MQEALAGLHRVALSLKVGCVLSQLLVFRLALQLFCGSRLDLRCQCVDPFAHFREHRLDAFEHSRSRAMTLFKRSHAGGML